MVVRGGSVVLCMLVLCVCVSVCAHVVFFVVTGSKVVEAHCYALQSKLAVLGHHMLRS